METEVQAEQARLIAAFRPGYGLHLGFDPAIILPETVAMRVEHGALTFRFGRPFATQWQQTALDRWRQVFPLFHAFMQAQPGTMGASTISLGDECHHAGLSFCDNRATAFLLPDCIFMDTGAYAAERRQIAERHVPWDDRTPVALWRGATTGRRDPSIGGWQTLPRLALCRLARQHPGLIDAGVTAIVQIADAAGSRQPRRQAASACKAPGFS